MAATPSEISDRAVNRSENHLPEDAFVLVNFNAHYKFHPEIFSTWMELLRDLPKAVLWLREGAEEATRNLKEAATSAGIDPARIVFAPRAEHAEHLARHRLADLALDTQYHTGGVTTLDALWAGIPVVTIEGPSHSERTGASILSAIGMAELICANRESYADLVRDLATNGKRMVSLRKQLSANRGTKPLFDPDRLARHLEAAYRLMWESWSRGESPRPIKVPVVG